MTGDKRSFNFVIAQTNKNRGEALTTMDNLKNINPHQQATNEGHSLQLGEYVIIQTYPLGRKLVIRWRTFDYREAWQKNEFGRVDGGYYPAHLSVRTVRAAFIAHGSRYS